MEQNNLPVIAKRIWKMVQIAYLMLRKGISKSKLMADLSNLISKRRKLAGKAIRNLLTLHSAGISAAAAAAAFSDYEFSCSNSPALPHYFTKRPTFFRDAHAQPYTAEYSPALPGFGRSPVVRQLRVTDSPFPVTGDEDSHVDKAAEEFINRFYKELRLQTAAE